jgi:hypothetical protein
MRIGVIGPTESEIPPFIGKISNKKLSEHAMLKFAQCQIMQMRMDQKHLNTT